ncbi:MAG TPA: hypothetical protein VHO50_02855 [Bacteroidales bacterium]|nr:hypothetical protein [Bacteroidales bacterium]
MSMHPTYRRILTKMGYYDYQSGLIFRNFHQEGGWDEHNRSCREYILKTVDRINPAKITVLGSGWLLDFPLIEIIERNISIVLVDIIHPPEVVKQVSCFDKVNLVEADVSGGLIKNVWEAIRNKPFLKKLKSIEDIDIPVFEFKTDPGLVVSLNILTQLEVLPLKLLEKNATINNEEREKFRLRVQQNHIDLLNKHKSVLISDKEEIHTDAKGVVKVDRTVLGQIPPGEFHDEWTWNFDLKGSDYYTSTSVMKVIAETFE